MRIKKEQQFFIILIIAILLVFLSSAVGGIVTFSLLRNDYAAGAPEPVKLKYSPPTTFSSEFQISLRSGLVKIIAFRALPSGASILDQSFVSKDIISYGFFVSSDGWIVTSYSPRSSFTVLTSDGETLVPQKIFRDKLFGLSFIKIDGVNFKALPLDGERNIAFGDDIFVIRDKKVFKSSLAHFGYPDAATKNDFILSSEFPNKFIFLKNEMGDDFVGLPVFSKKGEVVGIVNNEGLIVPVNLVKTRLKNLWKNESLVAPYLGAQYFDLSVLPVKIKDINLKKGAYIFKKSELGDAILKNSPAQRFGLLPGDIILTVVGDEINEDYNLAERIQEYQPGQKIDLEILRNGERTEVNIELGEQK